MPGSKSKRPLLLGLFIFSLSTGGYASMDAAGQKEAAAGAGITRPAADTASLNPEPFVEPHGQGAAAGGQASGTNSYHALSSLVGGDIPEAEVNFIPGHRPGSAEGSTPLFSNAGAAVLDASTQADSRGNLELLSASQLAMPGQVLPADTAKPESHLSALQATCSQKTFCLEAENPTVQAQACTGLELRVQASPPVSAQMVPVQLSGYSQNAAAGMAAGNEDTQKVGKPDGQQQAVVTAGASKIPTLDAQDLPARYESTKSLALSQIAGLPSSLATVYWKALLSSEDALAGKAKISQSRTDLALATSEAGRLHSLDGNTNDSNNLYRQAMGLSALIETRLLVALKHANIKSQNKNQEIMDLRENILRMARQSGDPQVCAAAAVVFNNELQDQEDARTLASWSAQWNFNRYSSYAYANDIGFMYQLAEAQALVLGDQQGALTTCVMAKRMWTDEGETAPRSPEWEVLPLSAEEQAQYRSLHEQTLRKIDPEGTPGPE